MALNGRVLLLNQTYEPLGTVSVARAIIMTFKNTVYVEELDGDRVLRSAHDEFPVPSVIRRRTYINVRRRREQSGMKRLRIYMRDKFRCQYCGEKKGVAELTLDHILPRSRGGDNSPVNIVTACVHVQQPQEQSHSGRSTHAVADFAVGAAREARTRRALSLRRSTCRVAQVPLHGRAR